MMSRVTRTRRGDKVTQGPCGHTECRGGGVWMVPLPCPLGPPCVHPQTHQSCVSWDLHVGLIMSPCPSPDFELSKGGDDLWFPCLSLTTGKGQSCAKYNKRKPQSEHAWWGGVMGERAAIEVQAPPKRFCNSRLRIWVLSSRWLRPLEQGSGWRAWWETASGQ